MATQAARNAAPEPTIVGDKLYMENTLLRVAGALFCHDKKRAPAHIEEIELNRGVAEKNIVIRPDPKLGQPGPLAHKIFVALIKKHSGYGRPTQPDVSFTKRELMRLIGRAEWGGRDSEQLARALDEIHHAFVRTRFKSADHFVEHSFNIFPEIYMERREHATDPIEACTVTLARPIMTSLQDGHFTCLNHGLMQQLGTVGQALFMRLFFHFANLYDGHHRGRLSFSKRYDDICAEWLGGLLVLKYRSKIEQEQLGPHLQQLLKAGFLASYAITEAQGRAGFVVTFRPGAAFFDDYDRFYRRQQRGSIQFDFRTDREQIAEPLKVAYLFVEKRNGRANAGIPYVPSKDVETAKYLLKYVSFADIPDFLNYAFAEAKKTRFDVQTLGGLKQYLSRYQERRAERATAKTTEARRQTEDKATQRRIDYDRFRRAAADRLFSSLATKEQAAIETAAHAKVPRYGRASGSLAQTIFEIERARVTIERYPGKIPSLEQWQHRGA